MRVKLLAGGLLIALGIFALVFQGISYTTRETIIDVGPIEAKAETEETIPIPPLVAGLAILGGAVLVASDSRRG